MKDLVDDILLLSRLDSNKEVVKNKLNLTEMVQETASYFKPIVAQKHLQLIEAYEPSALFIRGNEELLEKALANILSNALRYAKTYIKISLLEGQIILANDGPPIAPADLPYIFDHFYKGDKGQTGIGLAMVKEIVKQHHGQIEVVSQPKETSFILSF